MTDKELMKQIRVRIMSEAYDLADRNDAEGYNSIKVMCSDVLAMITPQREWVGLTKEEAKEISLANRPYVIDMIAALEARLKEKNGG